MDETEMNKSNSRSKNSESTDDLTSKIDTCGKAEKIVGARMKRDDIYFLVKFENNDLQFVRAVDMKKRFPNLVFKYYEDRLMW